MRVKVLYCGHWQVVAPIDIDGLCAMDAQLVALSKDKKLKAFVVGFRALWQRIPRQGPRSLGTDLYHCVDANESIYEFIKGNLRLLCFESDGAIVVCSHIIQKRTQKTPLREVQRVIELKERFKTSKAQGKVQFEN